MIQHSENSRREMTNSEAGVVGAVLDVAGRGIRAVVLVEGAREGLREDEPDADVGRDERHRAHRERPERHGTPRLQGHVVAQIGGESVLAEPPGPDGACQA